MPGKVETYPPRLTRPESKLLTMASAEESWQAVGGLSVSKFFDPVRAPLLTEAVAMSAASGTEEEMMDEEDNRGKSDGESPRIS